MKQIILDLKNGKTVLEEIPVPVLKPGYILIRTVRTLVSPGTERMLVEFSKANIINKARQQPDRVKQVLDKIRTDGILPTIETVFRKLDEPLPLGYSNAGEIIAVGGDVQNFKVGDRVVSNGHHAEFVCVPYNLVAKIPDNVNYDEASFTVIAAIALQGIRLADVKFGETVVVIGLGLIGLIACELLKAAGCNVIGTDINEEKIAFAKKTDIEAFNSEDENNLRNIILSGTAGHGADAVIITASAKSDTVISLAASISRKKGKVVLIGVIGLNLKRDDFYKKEITFQVSSSYGPGRYDDNYEDKGQDYPYAYVRWTAQRNFEAVLNALSGKKLDVTPLISLKIKLQEFEIVYNNLNDGGVIGAILEYPETAEEKNKIFISNKIPVKQKGIIGIIGAGNFTKLTLLPNLYSLKANVKFISSAEGLNATVLGKKYGIPGITTQYNEILKDEETDSVIITTRHDMHARIVKDAILADKNILVEKPLCLTVDELNEIEKVVRENKYSKTLMVGFNRRYAPLIQNIKKMVNDPSRSNIVITVNAGYIPPESWVHDMRTGGGRIVGEACHFIDLAAYLSASTVVSVFATQLGNQFAASSDNVIINLKMANGAQASIQYFSNGNRSYSKERIELYNTGKVLILDNFKKLITFGYKNSLFRNFKQNKGHRELLKYFLSKVTSGTETNSEPELLINSTRATFAALTSMQTNTAVTV